MKKVNIGVVGCGNISGIYLTNLTGVFADRVNVVAVCDLIPELSAFIERDGGVNSKTFKYLAVLDGYERMMEEKGFDVSNGLRAAVLMTAMFRAERKDGSSRRIMQYMMETLKIPKATYFTAVTVMEAGKRLEQSPTKGKQQFIYNRSFLDALDYNRIVLRAEKRSEAKLNEWADLSDEKTASDEEESLQDEKGEKYEPQNEPRTSSAH